MRKPSNKLRRLQRSRVSDRLVAIFAAKSGHAEGDEVDVYGHKIHLLRCSDRRAEEEAWIFAWAGESEAATIADLKRFRAERDFDFHENINRTDGDYCARCGKKLAPTADHWIRVHNGGVTMVHADDPVTDYDEGGDLGCWRIGPECAKRMPAGLAFREAV